MAIFAEKWRAMSKHPLEIQAGITISDQLGLQSTENTVMGSKRREEN
jgi:hypothetical protein